MIDVLIPTHNSNRAYLREALASLMNQTYENWECFIHDDSEEDIRPMIEDYLQDPRFTYVHSDDFFTIGGNWNACLEPTNNEVVAYLFQDDTWSPDYLETALKVLEENPDIGLVSMGHHYKIEGGIVCENDYTDLENYRIEKVREGRFNKDEYLQEWIQMGLRPNVIGEPDYVVMRRSVMEKAGPFHPTMHQRLDAEYWVRMLEHTDWYHCKGNYGDFRVHIDATSSQNREAGRGLYDAFQILQDYIDRTPQGPIRKAAQKAQISQFEDMAKKYMEKRNRGDKITHKGGSVLKKFCMRHPFVAVRTLLKTLM